MTAMKVFQVQERDRCGDDGHILRAGLCERMAEGGPLLRKRTGPFVPPISFPFGAIVVADSFRRQLESASIRELRFGSVEVEKVVALDWHGWNQQSDKPLVYPEGGKPEDYILKGRHSPRSARHMQQVWELQPPAVPCVFPDVNSIALLVPSALVMFVPSVDGQQVDGTLHCDQCTANWLQNTVGGWVRCTELRVVTDPRAIAECQREAEVLEASRTHLSSDECRERALAACRQHGYALPAAFQRPGRTFDRYLTVSLDRSPPSVNACTYDCCESLAAYLEHQLRIGTPTSRLRIHDLERGCCLAYGGHGRFRVEQ